MPKKAQKKAKPKKAGKKPLKIKGPKPIGKVLHFYTHISVAVIKFSTKVPVGSRVEFRGATTDFAETLKSMQFDHKPVTFAKKGQAVGVKVKKRVREGDLVYPVRT